MTTAQHVRRLGLLLVAASALLSWLIAHTDVFFADGLRYIGQAKTIGHGSWNQGLVHSVDHPIYPTAIAVVHRVLGGNDPRDWQTAAQVAAAISGVLLCSSHLPDQSGGFRAFGRLAGLFVGLSGALQWSRARGHTQREHILAVLDLRSLVDPEVSASGRPFLGSSFDRVQRASLSDPPRGAHPTCRALGHAHLAFRLLFRGDPSSKTVAVRSACSWWGPILMAGPFMIMKGGISTKPSDSARSWAFGSAALRRWLCRA